MKIRDSMVIKMSSILGLDKLTIQYHFLLCLVITSKELFYFKVNFPVATAL